MSSERLRIFNFFTALRWTINPVVVNRDGINIDKSAAKPLRALPPRHKVPITKI
jgi:hypothetical protein